MTHVRQLIREAFAARLTGLSTTGDNVHQSRLHDLESCELPCLLVYTGREVSGPKSIDQPRRIERVLRVIIEAVAEANTDLDDLLEQMAEEVEIAIGTNPTFDTLCRGAFLAESEPGLSAAGRKSVGINRLQYEIKYATFEDNPGAVT